MAAKVTKEHFEQYKKGEINISEVASSAGVTKQAVVNMFKKYESQINQQ